MRLRLMAVFVGLSLASLGFAAERATVDGFLVDKMCASSHASEGEKFGAMHKRDCALMPDCVKSGYGVVTADGKYLVFDKAGNDKALAALKKTDKADNLRVSVTGSVEGEQIQVSSLTLR